MSAQSDLIGHLDAIKAALAFDHRGSIVTYFEDQANKLAIAGRREDATLLRAQASNVRQQFDVNAGKDGIASPVDAIILELCAAFGGATLEDIVDDKARSKPALRVYYASAWVAKKRLRWTAAAIADHLDRERSTISHALQQAENLRSTDDEFRRVTDELTERMILCEHCQAPLCPTAAESRV